MKLLTPLIVVLALVAQSAFASATSIARNQRLGKGVNVGNYLDATPVEGSWTNGDLLKPSYFAAIRAKGFQSIRLPVRWSTRTGLTSPYTIDPVFLNRVDSVVTWALRNQLAVVLDDHHHEEFWLNPTTEMPRLKAIWTQIAARFTSPRFPDSLVVFEPINEPNGISVGQWNTSQAEIVNHIRALQPNRTLMIEPTNWSGIVGLSGYTIPADTNLIVSVHNYEPFQFTHQGASWVAGSDAWIGTRWGGATDSANLAALYAQAQLFGVNNSVPMNVGEFGALAQADRDDRLNYLSHNVEQADARGMSHMVWMFSDLATFGAYDTTTGLWDDSLAAAVKDGGIHPGRPVPAQPILWKRTQVSASVNGGIGWIATYNDSGDGGNTVVAPRSAFILDSIVANSGVLPFRVTLGTYIYAYSGMTFGVNGSLGNPTDASGFGGMNVVYSSNNPTWLNLGFVANDAYDHPRALLPSTGGLLDTVRVSWGAFTQQGWGTRITVDPSSLTQVVIQFQKQAGINTGSSVNFRLHCLGFDSACEVPSVNQLPRVVAPIPDQEYELNFSAKSILLSGRFVSTDGPVGYSVSSKRSRLTAAIDGSSLLLYSKPGITGMDTVLVRAYELGQPSDSVVDSFVVKIRSVNQAPVRAAPVANQVRSEDFADTLKITLANVFTDADDSLAFTATHSRSIVDLAIVGGVLRIRSVPDSNGVDTVFLTATETGPTGLSIADTFLVTVNKVNDKPRVVAPPSNLYLRVNADTVRIPLKSVFRSPDGAMTFTATSKRSRTSLLVRQDTLLLAPKKDTIGLDTVIVKARETATPADSVRDTIAVSIRAIRTFATLGTIDFESNPAELDTILESNRYESHAGLTLPVAVLKTSPLSGAKSARFVMTNDDFSYSGWQWLAEWEGIDASPTALVRFKARGRDTRMLRVSLNSTAYPILDNGILYGWSVRITPRDSVYTLPITTASYPSWSNCSIRPTSEVCLERRDSVLKVLRGLEFSVSSLGTSDSTWFDIDDIELLTNEIPAVVPSPDLVRLEDAADTTLNLTKVFSDVDDSLTYAVSSLRGLVIPSVDAKTVLLHQVADTNGVDTLILTATEARVGGRVARDTFVVSVTPVNDLPTLLAPFPDQQVDPDFPDTIRVPLKARFKSPDGPLVFSTKASLSKVVVSVRNDTLLISSRAGYRGTDTIAVRATEQGGTDFVRTTFLFRLVVTNAPTVVTASPNLVRLEDAADTTLSLTKVFSDADDSLSFTASTKRGLVTATVVGKTVVLHQLPDSNGVDTVILRATEQRTGGNSVRDTFLVSITSVNDVPTLLTPFADLQKVPDFTDTVRTSLKGRFKSPDGPIVFSTKASLSKVVVSIRNDSLLIASRAGYRGTDTIAVRATEQGGTDFVRATFLIRLVAPNALPVVTASPDLNRLEDAADTTLSLTKVFSDADDSLTFTASTRRGLVTATLVGKTVVLRQLPDSNGIDTVYLSATENRSGGRMVRDTFVVRIAAVNDVPTVLVPFADLQPLPDFADTIRIALKGRFKSPDAPIVFSTKASLSKVIVSIRNDSLLIASRAGYRGTDTIAVRATEQGGTDFVRATFLIRLVIPNAATVVTRVPDIVRLEDAADTTINLRTVFQDSDDSLRFSVTSRKGLVQTSLAGAIATLRQPADSNGVDTVIVSATETRTGGNTVRDTFVVRINAVNDVPTLLVPFTDVQTVPDFTDTIRIALKARFKSPDGPLVFSSKASLSKVLVSLRNDTLLIASRAGYRGTDTIAVRATEVGGTDFARGTFLIRLVVPNVAPVVTLSPNLVRLEDAADTTISLTKVFADADDSLTFTASSKRGIVTATLVGKTVVLHQLPDSNGVDTVYLSAAESRAGGRVVRDTFSVRVTAVSDTPSVLLGFPNLLREPDFDTIRISLGGHFKSPDGPVVFTTKASLSKAVASVRGDTLLIASRAGLSGTDTIAVRATEVGRTDYARTTFLLRITNDSGVVVDARDGQSYKWVRIGSQKWMAENLAYRGVDSTLGVCHEGDSAGTCAIRGRLYTWSEVMSGSSSSTSSPSGVRGACPVNWHVPSDSEWKSLELQIGMSSSAAAGWSWRGMDEGTKLKASSSLWSVNTGVDAYGFAALPTGYGSSPSELNGLGISAGYWTSTQVDGGTAIYRALENVRPAIDRFGYPKIFVFAVRCVKDSM